LLQIDPRYRQQTTQALFRPTGLRTAVVGAAQAVLSERGETAKIPRRFEVHLENPGLNG